MNIQVLSLARTLGRRARFIQQNKTARFTVIDAVDGAYIAPGSLPSSLFHPDLMYSASAYGCALSHLERWHHCVDMQEEITVVEDDAILHPSFEKLAAQAIATLPADWDIVYWGWNFDSVLSISLLPGVSPTVMFFDQEIMRCNIDTFLASSPAPHCVRLDGCYGSPAYTVSPKGAAKLISRCFPITNFEHEFPLIDKPSKNTGIDSVLSREFRNIDAYVSLPPLVLTKNEHAISTIQDFSSAETNHDNHT